MRRKRPAPSCIQNHQHVPVLVSFEGEVHATGPLKLDIPQYDRPVILIEHVTYINEEENPIILMCVMLPHQDNHVTPPTPPYPKYLPTLPYRVGLYRRIFSPCLLLTQE